MENSGSRRGRRARGSVQAGGEPGDGAVRIPIEDALDLHPFSPREIPDVVETYLDEASALGFREVRLIHGKGIGVRRERIRALLETHPLVESFGDAPAERGHWGATIVRLKPRP